MTSATISKYTAIIALSIPLLPRSSLPAEPLPPPFEGALITNVTDVNVVGTFSEDERFTHTQTAGNVTIAIDGTLIYQSAIDQAETRYADELRSTHGTTTFSKNFSFNTHPGDGNPNIETDRTIGFEGNSGTLQNTEQGSVSIFHNTGFNACVEQTAQGALVYINADNECWGAAGGSNFFVTSLSSHSETELTATSTPSVHHSVNAHGQGSAEAELSFIHTRGPLSLTGDCAVIYCPGGGESCTVACNENTTADGTFSAFHKDLFAGVVESYQAPQPSFFSGLITCDALCPLVP